MVLMGKIKTVCRKMWIDGVECTVEYDVKVKKKKPKTMETSKLMLFAVMVTYFIGLAFAIYSVNKILMDYPEWAIQALIALFGYIGAPVGIAIGFYSWKSKNENVIKIENIHKQSETEG
jgi:hypothetical protein